VSYIPLEPSRLEPARAGAEISKHRGLYVCITYVLRTNIPHFQQRWVGREREDTMSLLSGDGSHHLTVGPAQKIMSNVESFWRQRYWDAGERRPDYRQIYWLFLWRVRSRQQLLSGNSIHYNFVSPFNAHQLHSSCFSLRLGIAMVRCLRVDNFSAGRDVQKLYFCTILQLHLVRRRCPDLVALGRRAGLERKS